MSRPRRQEPEKADPVWTRGEQRLSVLTPNQLTARIEKVKAELTRENPFFARHWKDGSASQDMVIRGRLIRQLAAEPMELMIVPPWLKIMCEWHYHPAQNLPL
jgi:hypothetical protein